MPWSANEHYRYFHWSGERWVRKRTPGRELTSGATQTIRKALKVRLSWLIPRERLQVLGKSGPFKEDTVVTSRAAGVSEHDMASAKTCS